MYPCCFFLWSPFLSNFNLFHKCSQHQHWPLTYISPAGRFCELFSSQLSRYFSLHYWWCDKNLTNLFIMEERPRGEKLKRGSFWGGGLLNWNDLALEAADMQIWNKLQICSSEMIWRQRKEGYDDDVVWGREADRKKCRKHFYAFPLLAAGCDRGLRFISRIFLFDNSLRQHCGCNFCRLQCNFNTRQSSLWVRPQCEGVLSRFSTKLPPIAQLLRAKGKKERKMIYWRKGYKWEKVCSNKVCW